MNRNSYAFSIAWIATLVLAAPAVGQLVGFPVFSVPYGDADGSTAFAAQFATGLNDDSGTNVAWGGALVRSMARVSFSAAGGYVVGDVDQATVGAQVALHVLPAGSSYQLSVQGGVGWMSIPGTGIPDQTLLKFPIGLAFQGRPNDNSRVWLMPRLNLLRTSEDTGSTTEKDFGISAGGSFSIAYGLSVHAAVDWLKPETGTPIFGAIGLHYILGR